jgi:transcriptional regulator with XRE-family HTH domain
MEVETLGTRIKAARVTQGISQAALARQIGVSSNAMGKIEHGITDPRASRIVALAFALRVSSDYLLGVGEEDGHTYACDVSTT